MGGSPESESGLHSQLRTAACGVPGQHPSEAAAGKAQGQERVLVRGRDRAEHSQMAGGIYSFSNNYFILRPKCGLTGLKRGGLCSV